MRSCWVKFFVWSESLDKDVSSWKFGPIGKVKESCGLDIKEEKPLKWGKLRRTLITIIFDFHHIVYCCCRFAHFLVPSSE